MRDVSVDATNKTVAFGGGCLWADVDDALWPHSLATVGGTVSHTGVGGLILHGGFGFLSGLHGLAIDCLLSIEVVLVDGTTVTASETENSDLFWAMRGAGSSFGVATSFTSRVFPQGEVWGGIFLFTLDKLPKLVDFFNFWAANNDGRQTVNLVFTYAPSQGPDPTAPRPPLAAMQAVQLGANPSVDGPAFFGPLLEIDALMKMVGVQPYPQINKGGDTDMFPSGQRYLLGGTNFTVPISLETVETISERFFSFSRANPGAGIEGSILMLEGIPNQRYRKIPTESMAFNSRGDYHNLGVTWTWNDPSFDGEVRRNNSTMQKEIRALGYNDGELKDGVGVYINYVNSGSMSAQDAFGSNGRRLGDLKKKYDPKNVFDKLWKLLQQKDEQW